MLSLSETDFKNPEEVRKAQALKILSCYEDIEKAEKKEEGKEDSKGKEDKFKHHRLMAGYHHLNEKQLADEAIDLHSASDTELHQSAKEKEKERQRHSKMAEEHMNRAKDLHDPKVHGSWNDTIPSSKEAMEYGKNHSSEVDKGAESKEYVKKGENSELEKALETLSLKEE